MKTRLKLKGDDKIVRKLIRLRDNASKAVARELFQGVDQLITGPAKKLCPVDTGRLRSTLQTGDPKRRGDEVWVEVSASTDYAVKVHEDLEAYHKPPTKAKYLEDPALRNGPKLPAYMRANVKKEFWREVGGVS